MNKLMTIIAIAFLALSTWSCQVKEEAVDPLMEDNIQMFSSQMCDFILESGVNAVEQVLGNEDVFKDGTTIVYGDDYFSKINIQKKEGTTDTWIVTNGVNDDDVDSYYAFGIDPKHLTYRLILKVEGEKEEGFHLWMASFNGEYTSENGHTARFNSTRSHINLYWEKSAGRSSDIFILQKEGSVQCVLTDGDELIKHCSVKLTGDQYILE